MIPFFIFKLQGQQESWVVAFGSHFYPPLLFATPHFLLIFVAKPERCRPFKS